MTRAWTTVIAAGLLLTLAACRRADDWSAPDVRYGETECRRCRMIISDERFTAAIAESIDGEIVKAAFDDLGCLVEHLRETRNAGRQHRAYVHHFETRDWLPLEAAVFIASERLESPMASNVAALASAEQAERLRGRYPGRTVDAVALLDGAAANLSDSAASAPALSVPRTGE